MVRIRSNPELPSDGAIRLALGPELKRAPLWVSCSHAPPNGAGNPRGQDTRPPVVHSPSTPSMRHWGGLFPMTLDPLTRLAWTSFLWSSPDHPPGLCTQGQGEEGLNPTFFVPTQKVSGTPACRKDKQQSVRALSGLSLFRESSERKGFNHRVNVGSTRLF